MDVLGAAGAVDQSRSSSLTLDRLPAVAPTERLRRDLWVSTADAVAYSLMVGFGETYIPAFAIALGQGPVAAGTLATVPLLIGAILQLVTPAAVTSLGTNRGWVVACTLLQAASFLPLAWWAVQGRAAVWQLLLAASVYWSAGMAGVPAWNAWMATVVPASVRTAYVAQRNRLGQFGIFAGFVGGGLLLQFGESAGAALATFAVLFAIASVSRLASTALLAACSEPLPPTARTERPARGPWRWPRRADLEALATRPSGRLVVFLCCYVFGAQIAAPYFVPYMLRDRGFSYGPFMLVVAVSFLAKALAMPALGRLASRVGPARLLWIATVAITPLSLLWVVSAQVPYLVVVQVVAGTCWAAYELAVALLLFEAVGDRERTGVVTVYNLGLAVATVSGAACGGTILVWFGEDRSAYFAVFTASAVLRLVALPLLRGIRSLGRHEHDSHGGSGDASSRQPAG